jgi:hypothetical protein
MLLCILRVTLRLDHARDAHTLGLRPQRRSLNWGQGSQLPRANLAPRLTVGSARGGGALMRTPRPIVV